MTTTTSTWDDVTTTLAGALPNFESRPQQDRLALAIEDSLAARTHLLGQAGCGVGKSFAYLAGAVAHAKRTRKPVIVATATKGLQDQIAETDGPFLARVLHPLFGDIKIVLVKGRGNYLCLDKFNGDGAEDVPGIAAIREELDANQNHTGDLDTFITEIAPTDRPKLTTSSEECPGKRACPFGEVCFAELAKQRAMEADVVVVSHALLMRDIEVRRLTDGIASLLPDPSAYVIDEGHEFEDYARNALGSEITDRTLVRFGDDVATFLKDEGASNDLRRASQALFAGLDKTLGKESKAALDEEGLLGCAEDLVAALGALEKLDDRLREYRSGDETETMQRKRLRRRLENLLSKIRSIVLADDDDLVRWVERETRRVRGTEVVTLKLAFAPIDLAPYLAENIWERTPAILTSATLALGDDFSFIARSLGIADYTGFDAGSPFDFAKQSALYVPDARYPEPTPAKREEWTARTHAEIGELVEASGGRALLLFTSRRAMDAAWAALSGKFQRMGLTVLRQGDAPAPRLLEAKRADATSVLFALKTFMTGVDLQGDCLRLVVIDKMPFPVPDDVVFAARARVVDARATSWHEKSFMALSVPTMALTLFQAHGRAIRTRTDRALIAIFDPRLRVKPYGKTIMRSLPGSLDVSSLGNARAYLNDLRERRDG